MKARLCRIWGEYTLFNILLFAGAQLGIVEGRGPISEIGYTKAFVKMIWPLNNVLQIHKWRKYCERFTDIGQ